MIRVCLVAGKRIYRHKRCVEPIILCFLSPQCAVDARTAGNVNCPGSALFFKRATFEARIVAHSHKPTLSPGLLGGRVH